MAIDARRVALLLASCAPGMASAQTVAIPAGPGPSGAAIGQPAPTATPGDATTPAATAAGQLESSGRAPAATADSGSKDTAEGDIVVTGSRIVANGYSAPTPVTVISATELLKKAPESLAAGLAKLPQFTATAGANVTSSQAGTPSAGNYLNLRRLGAIETLLLLDGQRLPPTSFDGTVDANIIPQSLVQRVDVVTGGASAAYGSDAVAGVVNFILDKKFEGLKGSAQYGISGRGDDHQVKFGLAAGTSFLDNRLHVEASFDLFYQPGITTNDQRPFGGNFGGGWVETGNGSATNPYTPNFNVRIANGTYGTLVQSARNAAGATVPFTLNGTTFDANGGYHKADLGTPTGTTNYNIGGADTAVTFGTTLTSLVNTKQGFGRADYDFGSDIHGFVQGSYTDAFTRYVTVASGTQLGSFQIFADNAFLPTSFRDAMLAQGVNSFVGGRVEADQTPKVAYTNNSALTILTGLNGKLFGDFKWNVNYSHGESDLKTRHSGNFYQSNWFAALDAVRGPQGNIVCRITITNPGLQDGCVPWNLFGNGSPSKASYAYFERDSTFRVKTKQDDAAVSVSGGLFDLPAGTVNIAIGGEFRHQSLNESSNNDPSVPIDLTGLRAQTSPYNLTFNSTNVGKANGSESVEEGFAEVAVPILRDKPLFRSLDLNAAARYTNYSVTGGIWAWKGGASWTPVEQLRFRGTYSQDIRAPTLYELFAGVSSTRGLFNDIHTNLNTNTITLTQGNPQLKPEVARTLTVGGVWQPTFLPGFSVSVDYFYIKIKDQITRLSTTDLNQRCEDSGGTDAVCAFINRPFPFANRTIANFPTNISQVPFNQASLVTKGIDYEVNYRIHLGSMLYDDPAQLDLRLIGNYTPRLTSTAGPKSLPVENAGVAGTGVPNHKFTVSAQFTEGPLSFGADVQYIGVLHYSLVPTQFYVNNRLPAIAYLNANISYDMKVANHAITLYLTAQNLTDKFAFAPQVNAQPTEFYPSFQSQYDVVGRYVAGGVRFKF
ncbi:TonB-dependent receptor [Polymorphobacter sp. PAMC 29334]|uniref:TonB-dependent receptor domain-containing protein n=1 Tax=Polymorphobacter sp. PAMC 29334 TaxID=2862331 RepID=UPI001C775171|nr:TonB-dependent receptor [Polymorphobacter sp. PAMC 29334]QYE34890.1 TonB-dependent receptor [Polymorphobacter sp. PAMC 29334]